MIACLECTTIYIGARCPNCRQGADATDRPVIVVHRAPTEPAPGAGCRARDTHPGSFTGARP